MQRSERSFIKNGKERKDQNVLLKRTDAQPWFFWANHSFSLSLTKNERFAQKSLKKLYFLYNFYSFFKCLKRAKVSLIPSEGSEWIAQVVQDKWATVSDSLRLLRRNVRCEQIAQVAHQKWVNERITHLRTFLAKYERFAPKFDKRIPNPEKCIQ